MKNDHFFSAFSRLDLFPKYFGQANGWRVLKLH